MRPADPETVARTPGHGTLTADADVVGVLDGVRHAVRGAEAEEDADASIRRALGAPQILVEVIVDGPRGVHGVERLDRDEQPRKEALDEPLENWSRIIQPGELVSEEQAR